MLSSEMTFPEKRALFKEIFLAVREHGEGGKLAHVLVWLVLWPWLTGVFRRQLLHWRYPPQELASTIFTFGCYQIGRLNLDPGCNLLATIPKNVERQLIDHRQREIEKEKATVPLEEGEAPQEGHEVQPTLLTQANQEAIIEEEEQAAWLVATLGEEKARLVLGKLDGEKLTREQKEERSALTVAIRKLRKILSDPE